MARTARAAAVALALLAAGARPIAAQTPRASVVLLMDLSYSLRLREGGVRRIDLLRDAVSSLVDARGIEWALLSFRDRGDFRVHVPFTEEPARIRAALPDLPDGRLSPIREAIGWAGEYLVSTAQTRRRAVVLVSDGVGTGGTSFAAAVGKGFADEGVALFVLGVEHKDNPALRTALEGVSRETGGGYFTYRRVYDLVRALARFSAGRIGAARAASPTRLAGIDAGGAAGWPPQPTLPRVDVWLLAAGVAGLGAFAALRLMWRRDGRRGGARGRKRTIMRLGVVHRDGRVERLHFERPPVRVGAGRDARVAVPGAGKATFALDWDRENVWLESAAPVIVNGVARTRKTLQVNDRIALAGARIVFLGMLVREESDGAPAPARPDLTPLAAVSLVLLVAGAVFAAARGMSAVAAGRVAVRAPAAPASAAAPAAAQVAAAAPAAAPVPAPGAAPEGTVRPTVAVAGAGPATAQPRAMPEPSAAVEDPLRHEAPRLPPPKPAPAPAPAAAAPAAPAAPRPAARPAAPPRPAAAAAQPSLPRPQPPPARAPAPLAEPQASVAVAAAAAAVPAVPAAVRAAFAAPAETRTVPRSPVLQVAPGGEVPFFKIDILFFHAHPDDESLDFAGLMALAARRGLKTAVVLFTDGETGIDQYPDRPEGGVYPAKVLTGADLARVRVEEADKAMEVLGAKMYVRLGLPNHPYNTSVDELRRDRILDSWGGEERLVAQVERLVRGFQPQIVVSSDFNEKAYEHFEHKAAGYVVQAALGRLFAGASGPVRPKGGYLVSVDPFQGPLYNDLVRLDLMKPDPASGLSYRELQMAALKEHATQADASLLGVEFLPNYRYEQYHPVYWNLPATLPEMLGAR